MRGLDHYRTSQGGLVDWWPAGPLCANCRADFHHLKVGKPCTACDDGRVDIPMMLGLIFAAVLAGSIVISGVYSMLVDHGIVTDLRLLLGFYQVLWTRLFIASHAICT